MFFRKQNLYQQSKDLHENEYALACGISKKGRLEASLYRPWGDGDPDFPKISLAIMERFFCDFSVATWVSTWNLKGKNSDSEIPFPRYYAAFLQAHGLGEKAFCDGKRELITLTDGVDTPLLKALLDQELKPIWSNHCKMFGYRRNPFETPSFLDVRSLLREELCDGFCSYQELHDVLELSFQGVQEVDFVEGVREICVMFGKTVLVE